MMSSAPRSHFRSPAYYAGRRGLSLGHQFAAVTAMEPRSVLEVGVGCGVLAAAIRQVGIPLTTLDLDPELEPDIVGSVEAIPADAGTWDVAACCQVLDRLPFARFGPALRELHRVTAVGLILGLPDVTRQFEIGLQLPRLGHRRLGGRAPLPRPRTMPPERMTTMGHHWEIGFRETPLSAVQSVIAVTGWRIQRSWRVAELPWHRFFELRHAPGTRD